MNTKETQDYKKLVGTKVRELRNSQGLSLRQLGLMIGVDYKYLFDIEHGKANATIDTLAKISQGLDVELKELFD